MNEFNPYNALIQCIPKPLSDQYLVNRSEKMMYQMVLPNDCCPWNFKFYVSIQLLEFDFSQYVPKRADYSSYLLPYWRPQEYKRVRFLDGSDRKLPVLEACICVNRSKHPQYSDNDDSHFQESNIQRARSIARELLYIEQYARLFDPVTEDVAEPIQEPTDYQIDCITCPFHLIEASLHTEEQRIGMRFETEKDFKNRLTGKALETYFRTWLTVRCVPRELAIQRTNEYLNSGMRALRDVMRTALIKFIHDTHSSVTDQYIVKKHMLRGSEMWKAYLAEIRRHGCRWTDLEIAEFTMLLLRRYADDFSKLTLLPRL